MKGSVRNLPHHKMQDIRRMFEENCDNTNASSDTSSTNHPSYHEVDTASHVKETLSKDDMGDQSPTQRWRQHISPPSHTSSSDVSPTRKPRSNLSPARKPRPNLSPSLHTDPAPNIPTPTPRRTVAVNPANEGQEQGLTGLMVKQFGHIAGAVALSESDSSRVSRLVGQMESISPYQTDEDVGRLAPEKRKDSGAGLTVSANIVKGAAILRKNSNAEKTNSSPTDKSNQNYVYASSQETCSEISYLSVCKDEKEKRPISVFERSKMFENISSPSPTAAKPPKPPPPARQRSLTEENVPEKLNSAKDTTGTKFPPKRPVAPRRQGSLVEKKGLDFENINPDNLAIEKADGNVSKSPKVSRKQPPMPPMKPPRTGAHDDYVKVKLDQQRAKRVLMDSNENCDSDIVKPSLESNIDKSKKLFGTPGKNKPTRPPPPSKRLRPFSVCTDTGLDMVSSDGSDSDDLTKIGNGINGDNPFYEVIPYGGAESDKSYDPIKHWDLPRISHPVPIRRSLSDDCIHKNDKAVDNEGNVVYMDPEFLGIHDHSGYDIYVDTEGYAIPSRIVKRSSSSAVEDIEPSKPIGDRVKSKIRRFKNFFAEPDKPSQGRIPVDRNSQKQKIDAIKRKVNQSFEALTGSWKRKDSETSESDSQDEQKEQEDNQSTDTDSRVDEREIRKRVEYSRSVRIKTSQSIKESRKYREKKYPQLFEYAMIVGLQLSQESGIYEPYVKYKFPEIKDSNVSVPLFCFPDAANFKPSSTKAKSQSYNFVLTNFDGGRVYGYCRRLVPPKNNKIPEVICIISPVDAFSMYNSLLEEMEKKRLQSIDATQELIAAAFGRPLPSLGKSEIIRTLDEVGDMETVFLNRGTDNRVENVNCECLLSTLGTDKLLKVFASILLERSVLFCAKQLSTLSATIHAITSLLYPFSWQHTFIPVLPATMIDVVCSPTPYIIGITSALIPKALTLPLDEYVLVVDVDKRSFITSQGDEGTLLPKKVEKALKTALNMCRIDPDAKLAPSLMISEAFLRFFVEAVGHYGQYILTQPGGQKTFQKEQFTKGVSSASLQQLLEWFVETQMFEVFVSTQVEATDWGNTIEYFQSRIQEHKFTGKKLKRRLAKKLSSPIT